MGSKSRIPGMWLSKLVTDNLGRFMPCSQPDMAHTGLMDSETAKLYAFWYEPGCPVYASKEWRSIEDKYVRRAVCVYWTR